MSSIKRVFLRVSYLLICAAAVPLGMLAASGQTGRSYSPTFAPGGLIAWWVCNARKRKPIGGYLLLYYWQLYGALLFTLVFFVINIQSYVPENFDNSNDAVLFLMSNVPVLLLLLVKCAIATLLLSIRVWDILKLLRWIMIAELAAEVLGAFGNDAAHSQINLELTVMTIILDLLWLLYFFLSTRVWHVFCKHDWNIAVNSIYPPKPTMTT